MDFRMGLSLLRLGDTHSSAQASPVDALPAALPTADWHSVTGRGGELDAGREARSYTIGITVCSPVVAAARSRRSEGWMLRARRIRR